MIHTDAFPVETFVQGENSYSDMEGAILNMSVVVSSMQF